MLPREIIEMILKIKTRRAIVEYLTLNLKFAVVKRSGKNWLIVSGRHRKYTIRGPQMLRGFGYSCDFESRVQWIHFWGQDISAGVREKGGERLSESSGLYHAPYTFGPFI